MYDKVANTWTVFNMSNGLTGAPISLGSRGNAMYVGHYQGIDVYENGTWTNIDLSPQGIEHVNHIAFDANDDMWLGTTNGLWKYDGNTWTNWNESNSNIAANYITGIDFDMNNNVYVSAHNTQIFPYYGGFSYFDGTGTTFTTFLDGSSPIAHKQVEDIALDVFGNVWTLTQSEGFSIYNPNGVQGFECINRNLERLLGVNDYVFNDQLEAYSFPNPFSDLTTVVFNSENTNSVSIEVFDVLGRTIRSFDVNDVVIGVNRFSLDLSEQSEGIYFCKISTGNMNRTIKLIKN